MSWGRCRSPAALWSEFLDLPLFAATNRREASCGAAFQSPWPGGVAVYGSPETSGYALASAGGRPTVMGETLLIALGAGQAGCHRGTALSASRSRAASLRRCRGCNCSRAATWRRCVTRPASGRCCSSRRRHWLRRRSTSFRGSCAGRVARRRRWSFASSGRGDVRSARGRHRAGEPDARRTAPAAQLALRSGRRATSATRATRRRRTRSGAGLRPLSPVHVRAARSDGDVVAVVDPTNALRRAIAGTWRRCLLGEDDGRYEVDILDGDDVVRTISSVTPFGDLYGGGAGHDSGAAGASVHVAVHQMSAVLRPRQRQVRCGLNLRTLSEIPMRQPAWLEPAWRELGESERAGEAHNARILAFYRDAGHGEISADSGVVRGIRRRGISTPRR